MLSHWYPNSRNRGMACALQLAWNQASTGFPEWPLTSSFSYPLLMPWYKRKNWCCCWESHTWTGATCCPAPPISNGICDLESHRSVRVLVAAELVRTGVFRAGLPTCGRWASGYLYSGWFYSGYYELFLQPWLLDVKCILVLKNWVLFGAMFFLRMIAGLTLIIEFCYSVFFSQLGI